MSGAEKTPMLAIALKGHDGPDDEEHEGEDDGEEAYHAGAKALLDAIEARDVGGVADAFRALHKLCAAEPDDDDDGGDS